MTIRSTLFALGFGIASLAVAHAEGLRPIEAKSVDLGGTLGVVYYTVEHDGFRVVATLAQSETGTPIRVVSLLTPGQRLLLSTPRPAGVIEISREGDSVIVRKPNTPANELRH